MNSPATLDCLKQFILNFFTKYNNSSYTFDLSGNLICGNYRRRSLFDLFLITKHYYEEVTFEQVVKEVLFLIEQNILYGSYCGDVRRYVFYTSRVSNHSNYNHRLEFCDNEDINFNNIINHFKHE